MEEVENPATPWGASNSGSFSQVVGVFAKEPLPGQVKTRLCPPLNHAEAAELYAVAQAETIARLATGRFELVLFYAGEKDYFRRRYPEVRLLSQSEGDLGKRMETALRALLREGYQAAALVGTDSPDLPLGLIEQAFLGLQQADALSIPATDGGYVLVGCRRPCPELFKEVPWSSAAVLEVTRARAAAAGIRYREIGSWEDLDDLAALQRLLLRSPESATAEFIRRRLGELL